MDIILPVKENGRVRLARMEKRIQDIQNSLKMTEKPGVYMEVLEEELC